MTGATGSVGKLLRPLLRHSFDMRLTGRETILDLAEGEEFMAGDLVDPAFAQKTVEGMDGVIHLAGLVAPSVTFTQTLGPNYQAVLNLLEACRQQKVGRFVFASSHHIIGMLPADRPWDGDAPVAPDSFYGLSKAFGEAACAMYARRFGIQTLVVRIGNADPEIVDGRRERIWTSGRDLADLVTLGLTHPELDYAVVNGVSRCDDALLGFETAAPFGYEPKDSSAGNRASHFRSRETLTAQDGAAYVGGFFAVNELPNPMVPK
ncbi:NAD-dependent epimerase/dehydratase family protein [Mesorhizobium sp. AaZ16]|uniref:NAD-dependent epimerase/dehydratase family protein n=1 Tax=Mesorhizobium sp. AaZ16 TaxID=3402289 RepID=UPI00374EC126